MGLYISAAGLLAVQRRQETTAHNVANAATIGFQAMRPHTGDAQGGGARIVATTRDMTPGRLVPTGQSLDAAPPDAGFFRIRRPDGSIAYTRDGRFGLDAGGNVVASGGGRVEPPVRVPFQARKVSVLGDGTVVAAAGNDQPLPIGRLEVVAFPNPSGLEALGGNLFAETAASGAPHGADTGVQPGFLAGSNVNLAMEAVRDIATRAAYGANANTLRAQDEVLGSLLDLAG
jgi:flagellar basal-body rod protein FlgG